MNIPKDLIDAIKKKECLLFVASGFSAQVIRSNKKPLPNWVGFLKELLEWAKLKGVPFNSDPSEIEEMINNGNLLMAAEELQEIININELGDFLNIVFRDSKVKPTKSHQVLTKIPFRAILTTNYDSLLEGAYTISSGGQTPKSFTPLDINSAISPLRKGEFFIFKMHGDLDRPDSIVLGSRSYNNLLFQSPNYLSFLETLFTTQTVLFLGFGGSDPDLDYFVDRLSTIFSRTLNKHYMLVPQDKFNFTEKRRFLIDKRLEVLEYDPKNNHEEVELFIQALYDQIKEKNEDKPHQKEKEAYVLALSSDFGKGSIVDFVDSLPDFRVPIWSNIDTHLSQKPNERTDLYDLNYEFLPSIALIELSKSTVQIPGFDEKIEHILLKELESKIVIIVIVLGDIEIPFKLRKFQHIRVPNHYSPEDLNELKQLLYLYKNSFKN